MKKLILPLLIASIGFVSCKKEEHKTDVIVEENSVIADKNTSNEVKLDSAAMEKAYENYRTPSKAHKMLAKDTGIWDASMTFWMPDNPEPQKAVSVAQYKMILGGLYQEGTFTGDMWGMPFEGRGLTAFDNATEEYIATWVDNFGTGVMITRGKYEEANNRIVLFGNMVDPGTKKEKKVKEVLTYIDDNNQKMEMFDVDENGKETRTMEIISKRR